MIDDAYREVGIALRELIAKEEAAIAFLVSLGWKVRK